jgi:glycine cleavage system aminomethyltransferase T
MAVLSAPTARTPLHAWHAARQARFALRDGWHVPAAYTTPEREAAAARAGAGLTDLSCFTKVALLGDGVGRFVQAIAPDSFARKPLGCTLADLGGPVVVCRPAADRLLFLTSTTDPTPLEDRLTGENFLRSDLTFALAQFGLAGPNVEQTLRQLTPFDVRRTAFPEGACAETNLAGVHALLVRPADQVMPSVRVCVGWDVAEYVWERLLEAGASNGLVPAGTEAWERLSEWPTS